MKRFTQFALLSAFVFGLCVAFAPAASVAQGPNFFNPNHGNYNYPTSNYASYSGYKPSYPTYSTPTYSNYSNSYRPQYTAPAYRSCYYSNWSYDQAHGYYFCSCNFRTGPSAPWSKYYCIYNTCYGNCVYYFNPVKQCYWCRYDALDKSFSTLGPADQHATIGELPQDRFSAPVAAVPIPGAQGNEQISAPPGLPTDNLANQVAVAANPQS